MVKDKKDLEKYLDQLCDRIVVDNDLCKSIYNHAYETYEIPKGIVSDLITKRMSMSEASEFILFILLDSIHYILNKDKSILNIDKFFTLQEAMFYRKNKYETAKIKFPLVFKMIQIADDQWNGKIDIKTLMMLRQAQLINYNVNAQRTMQRIVKGDKERYKITLNNKAVNEIAKAYSDGTFISNTLTLNIPLETNFDFYYDDEKCTLIIKSLEHFDITDGFHRYIAACQVSDKNSDFNYNMELRIVNFTEDKAKQMIFQEDQKTQMRKIDSNSMNMNKAANIVVERLNDNIRCNLKGLISRNEGTVPFAELAELVHYFYFKGTNKEKERSITIKAVSELTNDFNMLTEYNTEYLERKMNYVTLLSAMFCFNYYRNNDLDTYNMCEVIERTAKELENSNNSKLKNKTPRKTLMTEVEKIMKGVM